MDDSDLLTIDDSTFNWMLCPSSLIAKTNFSNSILEFVFNARYSSFFRYLIITGKLYSPDQSDIIFIRPQKKKFTALYQQISTSVIQIITYYFYIFFENQEKYIPNIHKFFSNKNAQNHLFSILTFPTIFFYFQTKEFSELGFNFIIKNIEFGIDTLTRLLILSFFDCFPRFNNNLWSEFEFRCYSLKEDVFTSFRDSIVVSFSHLTLYHKKIISRLLEENPKICSDLFFREFLLSKARTCFHLNGMNDQIIHELFSILEFCSKNYESPHSQFIIDGILSVNNYDVQILSFNENISLPTVSCVTSPCEMHILYELFDTLGLIKVKKLTGLIIPENKRDSMLPGHIQFTYRKIISGKHCSTPPLIFCNSLDNNQCNCDCFNNEDIDNKNINNESINNENIDNGNSNNKSINNESINNENINNENINNGNSNNKHSFCNNNVNSENKSGNVIINCGCKNKESVKVGKHPIFSRIFKELYKVSFENSISIPKLLNMKDSFLMQKFSCLKMIYSPEFIKYFSYKLRKIIRKSEQLFEDFMIMQNTIKVFSQLTEDFLDGSLIYMSEIAQSLIEFSLMKSKTSDNVRVEFAHPEGFEFINERYGNMVQLMKEKEIVENSIELKITDFPATIPTISDSKSLCQLFSSEFYFILLQIWSPENKSFLVFLKLLTNQLLLSHKIDEKMMKNVFFRKILKKIKSMKGIGIGRSFKKMTEVLRDLKMITKYYYDEYNEGKYANVAMQALFHVPIMEPILTMTWFTRLSINIPMFQKMLDSTDSENWRIVSENIWSFANKTDRVLIEGLNEYLGNIPKYVQQK